jgi:hypothetical protein
MKVLLREGQVKTNYVPLLFVHIEEEKIKQQWEKMK